MASACMPAAGWGVNRTERHFRKVTFLRVTIILVPVIVYIIIIPSVRNTEKVCAARVCRVGNLGRHNMYRQLCYKYTIYNTIYAYTHSNTVESKENERCTA